MSSQPYQAGHPGHQEASYMTLPTTTTTTTTTDEMSEKTVEMDTVAHSGLNRDSIDSGPYPTKQRQPSLNNVPSYMAPTKSAKAKLRGQGPVKQQSPYLPQWNPSTRKGFVAESGFDSSSSGGGTITYQAPRSPSPKSNGTRPYARRSAGYSPTSNGVDDWPLGGHAWRHDFG